MVTDLNSKLSEYCNGLKGKYTLNNKILLVKVPQVDFNYFEKEVAKSRGYQAYPPTGLQYLSAAIRERNLDTDILDMNYEFLKRVNFDSSFDVKNWMDTLEERVQQQQPSIIGVSNTFDMFKPNLLEVLSFLKEKWKKSIVVAGGQNVTYEGEALLDKGLCHFVCKREGEMRLNYLLDHLYTNRETESTNGILFNSSGKIIETEGDGNAVISRGDLIEEHKLNPSKDYHTVGTLGPFSRMAGDDVPFATLLLNRGCRANCDFCTVRDFMGKGVRQRETKDVLSEIEYLYAQGIRHFEWLDDDFTYNKKAVKDILQGIKEKKLDITWSAQNGLIASTLDEEILGIMRDSNCIGFKVGVESGSKEVLRKMRKPGSPSVFRKFSERMQKYPELFISLNYILGFEGENFGQTLETFNFSGEMNSDWSAFSVYQPIGNKKHDREKPNENFIPIKSSARMEVGGSGEVLEGKDIFYFPKNETPSNEQLKQIWFTFNFIRNFVHNKNLFPGGNLEKITRWFEVLHKTYPLVADISFYSALANAKKGSDSEAQFYLQKTKKNMDDYWKKRFGQFGLTDILNDFPQTRLEAEKALASIRDKFPSQF